MKNSSLLYRALLILGLTLVAVFYLVPTLVTDLPQFWKDYLPVQRVHLGLDLQGGTHLVLTVDIDKAIENTLDRDVDDIKKEAARREDRHRRHRAQGQPRSTCASATATRARQFTDLVKERFPNLAIERLQPPRTASPPSQLAMTKREEQRVRELALEQSLETIRNRIDQFGVTEPIIQRQGDAGHPDPAARHPGSATRQGSDRPHRGAGVQDAGGRAGRRGDHRRQEAAAAGHAEILKGAEAERVGGRTQRQQYLVQSKTLMTGDTIADALVRPATQMEGPYVALELNARGAKLFDALTARQRRQAAGHHARQQRLLGAGDPRAHRRRPRVDHRQLRHQGSARPGDRAAGRGAAGAGARRRGAHRRAVAGQGLDPARASHRSSSAARWSFCSCWSTTSSPACSPTWR